MPHQVKGILTVLVDETVTVGKIDTLIGKNGFDLESIYAVTNGVYFEFFIDEITSTSQTIDPVLEELSSTPGVKGAMWVNDRDATEPYWVTFSEATPKAICMELANRFFDKQKQLIDQCLQSINELPEQMVVL